MVSDKWQSVKLHLDNISNLGLDLEAEACSVQSLVRELELELISIRDMSSEGQVLYNRNEEELELDT